MFYSMFQTSAKCITIVTAALTTRVVTGFFICNFIETVRKPRYTYRIPYEYIHTFLNIVAIGGGIYAYKLIEN